MRRDQPVYRMFAQMRSWLRAMSQRGVHTRADMIRALGARDGKPLMAGLTGNLTFGPDHGRVDEPIVYVVEGADIRALR